MLVYNFEGVPRNPLIVAIKNVLTFGIHTKIWLYRVNREMDGRESFHIHLGYLALMLWVPIVTPAIVKFQTAARLNQMVSDPVTIPLIRARRLGWISLVPVIGAGFYAWWVQSSLNRFWFWHRRKERIQLNKEKIKEIAQGPESEVSLRRRFELEEECRSLEREMEEEIEAVALKWGEERFSDRKKRADLHAQRGRLSRKQVLELRRKETAKRKQERARRRLERSLIARYRPRRADPEKDGLWEPFTPLPRRTPDEIMEAAKQEERDLTKRESKELKRAERLLTAREKETARLEKHRAKLLARKRKKEARLEAQAEKKAAKGEKSRRSKKEKKQKKSKKSKKKPHEEPTQEEGEQAIPDPKRPRRRWLVLPPERDPEVDEHWRPATPEPAVDPDEIVLQAESEGRELTKKERKTLAKAEKLLEKREKEEEALEAERKKARTKAEKQEAALEAKRKQQRKKLQKQSERQEEKGRKKDKKKGEKDEKKEKKGHKGKGRKKKEVPDAEGPQKRPVKTKGPKRSKREKAPAEKKNAPDHGGSGDASLKLLKVRCPQCANEVPVKKRDDRPARLKCPSCGLVGKV